MKTGVELIAAERQRQIKVEGWTPEHDGTHERCEIVKAAICYAAESTAVVSHIFEQRGPCACGAPVFRDPWPWADEWDKRIKHRNGIGEGRTSAEVIAHHMHHGRIRCLEIAGALIAAEIDRLNRAAEAK